MEKPGVQRFREGGALVYGTIGFVLLLVLGVAMIAVGTTLARIIGVLILAVLAVWGVRTVARRRGA